MYTTTIPLGTAVNFAILAGSGITFAAPVASSQVTGDIGTFPTASITGLVNVILNGVNRGAGAVTQAGKVALTAAIVDGSTRAVTGTIATELGGTTVVPGVYDSAAGDFQITGVLTIDGEGDPNSVFIFKTASTFITAPGASMLLTNGAQACNVFFVVGSSATLDTTSQVDGNILAEASITLNTGAVLNGRALASSGAVTVDDSSIEATTCDNQPSQVSASTFCVPDELAAAVGFGLAGLNPRQWLAALIYFKVLRLAALGGTDYTGLMTSQLITDSVAFQQLNPNQRQIALLAIERNLAILDGATVPGDVNELNAATACCFQSVADLGALSLFLDCQLSFFGS